MSQDVKAKKCKTCFACLAALLFGLMVFAAEILRVVEKVRTGHGLDYYITFEGYKFNYIGALVGYLALIGLVILWPAIHWVGYGEERSFKQKYGIGEK